MPKKIPDKREPGKQVLGVDENNAVFICPECKQLYNPRCGNCFHNAYRDENPLEPGIYTTNPELNDKKPQGKRK